MKSEELEKLAKAHLSDFEFIDTPFGIIKFTCSKPPDILKIELARAYLLERRKNEIAMAGIQRQIDAAKKIDERYGPIVVTLEKRGYEGIEIKLDLKSELEKALAEMAAVGEGEK